MIKLALFILVILFSACSFKAPVNQWQYKSVNAFESYKKNFLSDNDVSAKNDLIRAVGHAKKSSDLTQLARVYLGQCALERSVGLENSCNEYIELEGLVDDKELQSYYHFITKKLKENELNTLPDSYKDFASFYLKGDIQNSIAEIQKIETVSSKLIAATLVKDDMSEKDLEKLLEDVSYHGYKKAVIYLLKLISSKTENQQKIQKLEKKIKILEK